MAEEGGREEGRKEGREEGRKGGREEGRRRRAMTMREVTTLKRGMMSLLPTP
jgi:flagellar biosynthesis/type III secretory pathway protein FliH